MALRGRALGGSTETPSPTPRRDGRSTKVARSRLPPPPPSERCAEVSTVTFPMRGRCPSSLAASHAHVWACSRAQERRVDPPPHDLQRFCARQMGSIGGEGWGKGSAMRRSEAPLASGEDPRTSFQQHASPVPSVAALGLGLLRLLLPWLGPPVCKIVINRISVLCVLVVALLSRPN